MCRPRVFVLVLLILATMPTAARADGTAFLGATTTPARRPVKGVAVGVGLLIVGFEFEYANTSEDETEGAPSLWTGMGNAVLQAPIAIVGMRFYLTSGAGIYRERLGTRQETSVGFNSGGGAKISLLGPLRLRLDYRVFKLRGDPLYSTVQRVYTGVNLAF